MAEFLGALDALTEVGARWNHSRTDAFSACRPVEVDSLFKQHGIDMRVTTALQAASREPGSGVEKKTVNSGILDQPVHCWVFAPRPATPRLC